MGLPCSPLAPIIEDVRVLVIEDEKKLASFIRKALLAEGFAVDILRNGDEVLSATTATAFDVIVLDPPSFTKSRATIQKAITGYKEINLRGMKLVRSGGFLVTSSCTNLVKPELFLQIIEMAAKDARRKIRQVTFQTQSSDHPIIWNMENTQYLKFLIVQVM